MTRYFKVAFNDGRKKKTVYLRSMPQRERSEVGVVVTNPSASFMVGVEVNKDGDEICPPGCDRRMRFIAMDAVLGLKEYILDRKYAELVPVHDNNRWDCEYEGGVLVDVVAKAVRS